MLYALNIILSFSRNEDLTFKLTNRQQIAMLYTFIHPQKTRQNKKTTKTKSIQMAPQAIGEWFHCKFFAFHFRFLKIERDSNLKENKIAQP